MNQSKARPRLTKKELAAQPEEVKEVYREAIREDLNKFHLLNKPYLWALLSSFCGLFFINTMIHSLRSINDRNLLNIKNHYLRWFYIWPCGYALLNLLTQIFTIWIYTKSVGSGMGYTITIGTTYLGIALASCVAISVTYTFSYFFFSAKKSIILYRINK